MSTSSPTNEMAMIENTNFSRRVRRMLGLSLHAWENVMLIALWVAALGAVFVGISTYAVVRLQKIEAADAREGLDKYKLEAGEQIAKADADAAASLALAKQAESSLAGANSRAEEARAVSAEANKRAAEVNKTAEGERLARVKIEEKLAPRSISMPQIVSLSWRLKPYAGTPVDILQIGESPEITHFRTLLAMPLHAAGLPTVISTAVGSGSFIGLSVAVLTDATDSEKLAATGLLSALNAEGIIALDGGTVKREDRPGFIMAPEGETSNKAPIRIYIGSKP